MSDAERAFFLEQDVVNGVVSGAQDVVNGVVSGAESFFLVQDVVSGEEERAFFLEQDVVNDVVNDDADQPLQHFLQV